MTETEKRVNRSSSSIFGNFSATWTLKDFSSLYYPYDHLKSYTSKVIHSSEGVDWKLKIYPNGIEVNHVSCLLECATETSSEVYVRGKYSLSLKNTEHKEIKSLTQDEWQVFGKANPEEDGFPQHGLVNEVLRTDLMNMLKGDTLIIQVEVVYSLSTSLINDKRNYRRCVNAPEKLADDLNSVSKQTDACDITIVTEDAEYKVHRLVLTARSKVFSAMLESHTAEGQSGRISVTDFTPEIIKLLIKFIYSGSVDGSDFDTATELLRAADKYALDGLKTDCSSFLISNMDNSNVVQTLIHADMFNASDLKAEAVKYFCLNKSSIKLEEYKEFLIMRPNILYDIINSL